MAIHNDVPPASGDAGEHATRGGVRRPVRDPRRPDPQHLGWMTAAIAASPTDAVLDVASGTGDLALALAQQGARVISFDTVAARQAQLVAAAGALAIDNVTFELGAAEALPFGDARFDIVTCRFGFQRIADPGAVLQQMRRVTRPAGRLAVIDALAPDDPALGAAYNRIERLRDPSHARALTDDAMADMFERCGVRLIARHQRCVDVPVERWLAQPDSDPAALAELAAALEAEIGGGAATGMAPFRRTDGLYIKQRWAIYILATSRLSR